MMDLYRLLLWGGVGTLILAGSCGFFYRLGVARGRSEVQDRIGSALFGGWQDAKKRIQAEVKAKDDRISKLL